MNVLSLFDGMSCGQLALKRAGVKVDKYFAAEIDKHAIAVTKENFPETQHLGDINKIQSEDLPKIDLLIGGSPCQSFSRGGDNSGFDGKSRLFWEFIRLLKETKPDFFLLENVVMKKSWESIITQEMGVEPVMIDSKNFSAQKRQRLYWTNIPLDPVTDLGITLRSILENEDADPDFDSELINFVDGECRVTQATKKGYALAQIYDAINISMPKSKTRRGRVSSKKTNTLDTACPYVVRLPNGFRSLTRTELERLQTVPDGYTSTTSLSQAKKMLGNGWTVDVIAHIFKNLKTNK
jgi:DNA (cytosine-5)-methyltransferase 3A